MRKLIMSGLRGLFPRMRKNEALFAGIVSAFLILGLSSQALANTDCSYKTTYASWYGHAKYIRTATGVYNHNLYFAASKTLPFGTLLFVENPRTKKSVIVKIVDRGPFVRGRSLDLSYGAARALGMLEEGVARVKVISLKCAYVYEKNLDIIKDVIRTSRDS